MGLADTHYSHACVLAVLRKTLCSPVHLLRNVLSYISGGSLKSSVSNWSLISGVTSQRTKFIFYLSFNPFQKSSAWVLGGYVLVQGFFRALWEALRIFLGFNFCSHSNSPVTLNPEYSLPLPPGMELRSFLQQLSLKINIKNFLLLYKNLRSFVKCLGRQLKT